MRGFAFTRGCRSSRPDGHALGTLCVVDSRPRKLTPAQQDGLMAIARQVEAQLRLRRSPARLERDESFRRLSSAASEGIVIVFDERVIEANNAFARLFGYEPGDLLGQSVMSFIAPESRDLVARQPDGCLGEAARCARQAAGRLDLRYRADDQEDRVS